MHRQFWFLFACLTPTSWIFAQADEASDSWSYMGLVRAIPRLEDSKLKLGDLKFWMEKMPLRKVPCTCQMAH
jgi:hypothetical protein